MLVSRVMEEQLASQMTQVFCDGGWLLDHEGKQQLTSLKSDVQLFSRLYIGCQTCDGDLDEFSAMKINPVLHHSLLQENCT